MKAACFFSIAVICFSNNARNGQAAGNLTGEILETKSGTQALASEGIIRLDPTRQLILEPGVKATKTETGLSLSSYDGSPIEVLTPKKTFNSTLVSISGIGSANLLLDNHFDLEGTVIARRKVQDDTDNNLKSMQESAKKLKSKTNDNNQDNKGPAKKLKVRWLYGENPNPTAELFNSAAIQQLTHLSNIGF